MAKNIDSQLTTSADRGGDKGDSIVVEGNGDDGERVVEEINFKSSCSRRLLKKYFYKINDYLKGRNYLLQRRL
jgi:hypothetical protein